MKLFQNLTRDFRVKDFFRISSYPYSESNPLSLEPYSLTDQNFAVVPEEKTFKEFHKKFHLVVMATRVFDGIKFCENLFKSTSKGTFLQNLVQIGPSGLGEDV